MKIHRSLPWLLAGILLAGPGLASPLKLTLDPEGSSIRFTLGATGHTVKGQAFLSPGTIDFDANLGTVGGTVTVDATRTTTDNEKRDRKMHGEVLLSNEHPTIRFELVDVGGGSLLPADGGTQSLRFEGRMTLAGGTHPLAVDLDVTRRGPELIARGSFVVPYVEWGLHDPSAFVLRVAKEVEVEVEIRGEVGYPARSDDPEDSEDPEDSDHSEDPAGP